MIKLNKYSVATLAVLSAAVVTATTQSPVLFVVVVLFAFMYSSD
jgi:hypothetical protein